MDALRKAGLPRPVRLLISQCTAADPADRPDGFTPICEALNRIITELNAGPTRLWESAPPNSRTHHPGGRPASATIGVHAPHPGAGHSAPRLSPGRHRKPGEFTRQFKATATPPRSRRRPLSRRPGRPRNPVPATRRAPEAPTVGRAFGTYPFGVSLDAGAQPDASRNAEAGGP